MTFNEFIKVLSPEQVNSWWDDIAPTEAPQKVEEENWKYKLSKNGKTLPFKYTISELALKYNLDFKSKDFSSNAANREAFCEAFDFEITEDLVYDNTEARAFIAFHRSLKQTSTAFIEASNYLHLIISTNEINPHKIRMALRDAKKQAMVIIGMRAVFSFKEENGKARIAMILDKEIYESNKSLLDVKLEETFNGKPENKVLISFEVSDWSDIPPVILQNHTNEFLFQYNTIKDTKRATWNTEANTTNSVFKYLLFTGDNATEWVNNNNLEMNNFKEVISNLERYLNAGESTIKGFKIVPKKLDNRYAWFYDNDKILGGLDAHYEIELRRGKLSVDIHFEDKNKTLFEQEIIKITLPEKIKFLERNPKKKRKEITYYEMYDLDTPDLIQKLADALLYLEENIGDTIRTIKTNIKNTTQTNTPPSNQVMKYPLNQILYGPPGTGKTYATKELAVSIINTDFIKNLDKNLSEVDRRKAISDEYKKLFELGQIVFTTFHQSMSYEDFIEGIKPVMKGEEEGEINYEIKDGIFKAIANKAFLHESFIVVNNFEETWNKLIELVLSNISDNKLLKIGSWEYGLSTTNSLKYSSLNSPSQYTFTITKQNIYDAYQNKKARPSGAFQKDMLDIVAFMKEKLQLNENNNSDKQFKQNNQNYVLIIDEINRGNVSQIFGELITLIEEDKRLGKDEALEVTLPYSKESFGVPSNLYIIGTMNTADRSVEALDTALRRRFCFEELLPNTSLLQNRKFNDFNLQEVLETINDRIEALLDRDHTIGHSYFMKVSSNDTKALQSVFENNIIPLLQEYFYHDYEKIALVLGEGFVSLRTEKETQIRFASFSKETLERPESSRRFELIKNISQIESAVVQLLNRA